MGFKKGITCTMIEYFLTKIKRLSRYRSENYLLKDDLKYCNSFYMIIDEDGSYQVTSIDIEESRSRDCQTASWWAARPNARVANMKFVENKQFQLERVIDILKIYRNSSTGNRELAQRIIEDKTDAKV